MRISIRGVSCSGKTTLAKRLSREIDIPHIELDELYWLPNWQTRDLTDFLILVENNLKTNSWVMDGNYSKVYNGLDVAYDYQIWLDYPFWKIMLRYLIRTYDRVVNKRKICNGNRERFVSLFSKDSLFIWILRTYWKRKKELLEKKSSNDERLIIIKNEKDINDLIQRLKQMK